MDRLLMARRRYAAVRRKLDPSCETDRELHSELTETIVALDRKIAECRINHGAVIAETEGRPAFAARRRAGA